MNNIYQHKIDFSELQIKRTVIYRALGYGQTDPPDYIIDLVDNMLKEISSLIEIQGGYRIIHGCVCIGKQKMQFDEVEFNTEKIITNQLKKSEGIIIFVCTLGSRFDNWGKHFMKEDEMLKVFIADVLGSEIVEAAVDLLESKINKIDELGHGGFSNRYSPGYCDWNVIEQHKLFSLLPEKFCDISLTNSALMLPIKSVSGIIGYGKGVKRGEYTCKICTMDNCYMRIRED